MNRAGISVPEMKRLRNRSQELCREWNQAFVQYPLLIKMMRTRVQRGKGLQPGRTIRETESIRSGDEGVLHHHWCDACEWNSDWMVLVADDAAHSRIRHSFLPSWNIVVLLDTSSRCRHLLLAHAPQSKAFGRGLERAGSMATGWSG